MLAVVILFSLLPVNSNVVSAVNSNASIGGVPGSDGNPIYANSAPGIHIAIGRSTTNSQRQAAARSLALRTRAPGFTENSLSLSLNPGGIPDYFGTIPNYANSPAPAVDSNGNISGGIRKFVDSLPGLGTSGANNIGQYIPIATADITTYNGSDYYEIGLVEYAEKMHSDLNPTILRGYVQMSTTNVPGAQIPLKYINGTNITDTMGAQVFAVDDPHYLGPLIIAQKDRPVRVKFTNFLPTGINGNLFIPVDTTITGAGDGPIGCTLDDSGNVVMGTCDQYVQNRGTIHLHGGNTPWISDGTQDQWTTPAGENTSYPKGVSVQNVPDMDNGTEPDGTMTFYYTNQQSARLMFYHDHAYGLTRLNVYAGVAAGYLETDQVEQDLISGTNLSGANPDNLKVLPDVGIPLIIQDKTFLPDNLTLAAQDPTWPFVINASRSDLWFPMFICQARTKTVQQFLWAGGTMVHGHRHR